MNTERFWSRVNKTKSCWIWTGYISPKGYGECYFKGKTCRAYRVSFEMVNGPIPDGMEIDHLCRNRACVNPEHLEAVSKRENILRGVCPPAINRRKKKCNNGHEYNAENTMISKRGSRVCRLCKVAEGIRGRARKRLKKHAVCRGTK